MQNKISTEKILENLNIQALNEMQLITSAAVKTNHDIMLLSATGSGKTLAFLLPILDLIKDKKNQTQAIIIVPSRELALQIEVVFKKMGSNLKITCCYGGHKREIEENNLIEAPALLVGTPGRLADHIRRNNIKTESITTLILDEFDKSLELGFLEEMSFIIKSLPNIKKRILTSATDSVTIPDFICLQDLQTLNFLSNEILPEEKLKIQMVHSEDKDKVNILYRLLCFLGGQSTIVFCNHRESVERTSAMLKEKGIANEFYHGAMEQQERDSALCKFRNGSNLILITTDLAARGLDIPNIRYIIHYHLPHTEEIFTHRNGRTARMESSGTAIILLSPEEKLPNYIDANTEVLYVPESSPLPEKPKWTTLFIAAGKKDKVNKIDIVGFLSNRGQLKKEDIGLIDVKDFFSFVAIRKTKIGAALLLIRDQKIKNKKVKIEIAK
jgi:superfamily II DNA/RNA helicase